MAWLNKPFPAQNIIAVFLKRDGKNRLEIDYILNYINFLGGIIMASKFKKKIVSMALAICMAASPIATLPMNVFAGSGGNNGGTAKKAFDVVESAKNDTIDTKYTLDTEKQPFSFGNGDVLDGKTVKNPGIVYAVDKTDNTDIAETTYIIADVDGMLNDLKDAFPYTAQFTDVEKKNNSNHTVHANNYTDSNYYVNSVSIDNNTGTVTLKDNENDTMSVTLNGVATVTGANSDTIQNTGNVIINIQDKTFTFQNGDGSSFSCPISSNGTMGWSNLYWLDIPNLTFTISFNPSVSEDVRSQVDTACEDGATLEEKLKALHAGYSALATAWENLANSETNSAKKTAYQANQTKCNDRAAALKEVINNCYENKVGDIEAQAGKA